MGSRRLDTARPLGLKRLNARDWLVFYSPKTSLDGGERLQAFTAIGRVADDELYQAEMAPGFVPWRRNVKFVDCVETPIGPLIDSLSFIDDKNRWGYMFRLGLFEIPKRDFELIKRAMVISCEANAWPLGINNPHDA